MIDNNLDILLLSMPVRAIDRPSLSLPVLSAYLKTQGFKVSKQDINMVFQHQLIEENELERLYNKILPLLLRLNQNSQKIYTKLKGFYQLLGSIKKNYGFSYIETIKNKMQDRQYEVLTDEAGAKAAQDIFAISANLAFYFTTVAYYYEFYMKHQIEEKIAAEMNMLFEEIKNKNPLIVGFSVIEVQRTFSIWAAKLLREKYNGVIMFGGSDVSLSREKYLQEYSNIDFVCWADGEYSVSQLIKAVKNNEKDYSNIPNLSYRKGSDIVTTSYKEYPVADYVVPDYEGFPMDYYILPAMQLITSKGCEWSKCMFCMHWNSYGQNFRQRTPQNVADEIELLNKKYNVRIFAVVDEAISADFGFRLSEEIIRRGLDIRWIQMSRLDSNFSHEVFKKLYEAGCRVIEWGLESGSQKVLNDMNKGVNVRAAQRLIHEAADAGIISKMLMFHNYPTEDVEDLMKSINIIKKNTYLHLIKPMLTLRHAFVLKLGSPLAEIAFGSSSEKSKYFFKVWKPESIFNVNAKYIGIKKDDSIKKSLVDGYLKEMRAYLSQNNVIITDNNNITLDLVLIDLIEKGHGLPIDVYLPRQQGGMGEYVLQQKGN